MKSVNDIKVPNTAEKVVTEVEKQAETGCAMLRDTSHIVVACHRFDYSASRIARAVEDCDVHVLSLAMTPDEEAFDTVTVDLCVDTPVAAGVARSIERYGYEVTRIDAPVSDEEPIDDTTRFRALEVLRMIDV